MKAESGGGARNPEPTLTYMNITMMSNGVDVLWVEYGTVLSTSGRHGNEKLLPANGFLTEHNVAPMLCCEQENG